jgi:hypothetical protein
VRLELNWRLIYQRDKITPGTDHRRNHEASFRPVELRKLEKDLRFGPLVFAAKRTDGLLTPSVPLVHKAHSTEDSTPCQGIVAA